MAKNSVRDFDATAANNTDIQSVDIAENCAPSGINNAIRELMADIKDVSAGTVALESPQADSLTVTGDLTVDTNTLFVDASADAVGIGTTSLTAARILTINHATAPTQSFEQNGTEKHLSGIAGSASFGINGSASGDYFARTSGGKILFSTDTGATAHAVIDSSGNLLVGKTSTTFNTQGSYITSGGILGVTRAGGESGSFNRTGSNGTIMGFYKDGTTVGTIGIFGGNALLINGTASIYAANNFRPNAQDTHDLGSASYRWRDIYTVGSVNTSDQNEKQQIAELTATELAAAKRISALFKTFKWNNAVEAKGDNARIHAGIIAQDVKSALEAEGLDASKYSFWCSDTWWEHDVEVPAVEAVEAVEAVYEDVVIEAVLDDEGNEVEPERTEQRLVSEAVEAVEAKDAYTRRDVYNTAEEAPEGAVEVTLQSVRYNELMAFVGAATEQRLTSIEARLTALEA